MKSAKTLEVLILTLPFNKRTEINCGLQGMIFISISIHIHPFTLIHTNISGQNIKKSTLIFFSADICFFIFKYQEKFGFNKCFLQAQALLCWPLNEGRLPGDHNWCLCTNFKITWNAHQDQRRHWRSWFDWYNLKYFLFILWFLFLAPNSWQSNFCARG